MNLPIPRGPSIIANPEILRRSPPDMHDGMIPRRLYDGVDSNTREWLKAEARRQRAAYQREQADAAAERLRNVQRVLSQVGSVAPFSVDDLKSLLSKVAEVAGQLAAKMPRDTTAPHRSKDTP